MAGMARYTAESKERVRDAVDMVDLVQTRTELRRSGATEMVGLCPFHDERTPSFGVNPVDKVYYCYGCQAAGDAFTFVMETEGVDFKGALELLADRCGVALEAEAEDPREAERRRRRERLMALLERTAGFYERVLWEADEARAAREYLLGRGLEESVLRAFRVGYSPSAWDRVLVGSRRSGFSERELLDAGLAALSQRSRQAFDRFRGRIMFPLADGRGRVIGFGARAMRDEQGAKYINTAEGELYHKGRQLYGAHLARAHASRRGEVIVCEGYTDVIALHQAGLENSVGIMGTSMTAEQVTELRRMAGRVLLALDADAAGQRAMERAARVAAERGLELRVVALPAGADPADLVRDEGAERVQERMGDSVAFVRFRVERVLAAGDARSAEGRDRILGELRPLLAGLAPGAMREELLRMVAGQLALPDTVLASLVHDPAGAVRGGAGPRGGDGSRPDGEAASGGAGNGGPPARVPPPDRREQAERTFLARCIALPESGGRALAELDVEGTFFSRLSRRAATHLREHLDAPLEGIAADDGEMAALMAELTVRAREPTSEATLELERLQLELARLDREIVAARQADRGDVATLATRRAQVKVAVDRAVERLLEAG